jgi:hypothetical protein
LHFQFPRAPYQLSLVKYPVLICSMYIYLRKRQDD